VRLCAILEVQDAGRMPGVKPATWVIRQATLVSSYLHEDGDLSAHETKLPLGMMRVCAPITMVQETLDLGAT
jgi:hypothetical protein